MKILVLLLLFVLTGGMIAWSSRFLLGRAKWRVSLRSLLALVALVAVVLASTIGYRRASMARFRWIGAGTTEAEQLFPIATARKNAEGNFEFVYYARNRTVQRLLTKLENVGYHVEEEAVTITARNLATAQEQLKGIRDSDKLAEGAFAIRGRVRNERGEPLAGAHVDMLGRFVFINCCKTRDDGTFTLPLTDKNSKVPAGGGYYFRIRHPTETVPNPIRWHSRYFSLDPSNPELVADIQVPE